MPSPAHISLQKINIEREALIQARTAANLKSVLVPFADRKIEEDLISNKRVGSVVSSESEINQQQVTITNRRCPESNQLLKSVVIRGCEASHLKCLCHRNHRDVHGGLRTLRQIHEHITPCKFDFPGDMHTRN